MIQVMCKCLVKTRLDTRFEKAWTRPGERIGIVGSISANFQGDAEKLLVSLQSRIAINKDSQTCSEAFAGLHAYYKVRPIADETCMWDLPRQHIQAGNRPVTYKGHCR